MRALLIVLILLCSIAKAQNFKYVNADSLALYEYPDTTSGAYIYLHPPTKIEVEEIKDERYLAYPEIVNNWYILRFFINNDQRHGGTTFKGYIRKDQLVDERNLVNRPMPDPEIMFSYSIPGEKERHDLRFYRSSKGGCYYINAAGVKEYVDFCRESTKKPR